MKTTSNNTNRNYQRELDKIIKEECALRVPSLVMHACCAPCSSYVIEYLNAHFELTMFFYNPNIDSDEEYIKRADELKKLIDRMPLNREVNVIDAGYSPAAFYTRVNGLENEPERGKRCEACIRLRLSKAAEYAKQINADYFSTTLTISPHKDAHMINSIGEELAKDYGVKFLPCDFKKREGFKRSAELCGVYGLYRQDYCGCAFSKKK